MKNVKKGKQMDRICGIDEAGRGCLAGSLFVCGVACDDKILSNIANLNDSKKLSPKMREIIYTRALELDIEHFVISFSASEIDIKGLSSCLKSALESIKKNLKSSKYIFDGNANFGVCGVETLISGDSLVPQISLASIIAKVHKDRESLQLHAQYPQYNLAKNKGYGTKEHIEAIWRYGYSPLHRKSFKIRGE